MLAVLITLAHFSVSSATSVLKSPGEPPRIMPPRSATLDIEERIGTDHERANPLLSERREGSVDLGVHGSGQYQSSLSDFTRGLLYVFPLDICVRVLRI
jgi:hypothetical protein